MLRATMNDVLPFSLSALRAVSDAAGFAAVGVAPVMPLGGGWFAPHAERFEAWLANGQNADMTWMAERAEARLAPAHLLPGAATALCFWLPHRTPKPDTLPDGPNRPPTGRIAAYAWGRDYHNVARKSLRKVLRWILAACPEVRTYQSIDTGAVLERAYAERAGLGWIGKSTMLISTTSGTFGSLAVIFLDRRFETEEPVEPAHPFRCGTCTACIDECPTGAIVSDGVVDARRCISYWTIEHRGLIPVEKRASIGDWLFGCDICQDVCPWNRDVPRASAERWKPTRPDLSLEHILTTEPDVLEQSLEGSPLLRTRAPGLRRNALIVAANTKAVTLLPLIERLAVNDPDPVVQATAVWAACVLKDADERGRGLAPIFRTP